MICTVCKTERPYLMKFLYINTPICWNCVDKFLEGEQQLLKRTGKTDIIQAVHEYRHFVSTFLTGTLKHSVYREHPEVHPTVTVKVH